MTSAEAAESERDRAARALFTSMGLLRRRLRAVGSPGELTFPEVAALARLQRNGPATSAELARIEQISPQSMGATLAGLQERGLVSRSADPDDGRRVVMSVTEAVGPATRRTRLATAAGLVPSVEMRKVPIAGLCVARAT